MLFCVIKLSLIDAKMSTHVRLADYLSHISLRLIDVLTT